MDSKPAQASGKKPKKTKNQFYAPKSTKSKSKKISRSKHVVKTIGGEKNGGTRKVFSKQPRYYPTQSRPKKLKSNQLAFSEQKRNLRKTITPGTILILVAGRHKGKRVVFLKQLSSGMLLVTGPYQVNKCPLRRINQIYVIATKTKIDLGTFKVPRALKDDFFSRKPLKKPKFAEGDIFETKKEKYTVSDERKKQQVYVDKQILAAIKSGPTPGRLIQYLASMFSLGSKQYPHKLVF